MALHAAIKGKLLSVIGDEVSSRKQELYGEILKYNKHIFILGYLRWIFTRWSW